MIAIDIPIANVSIKKSETDYELVSIEDFLKIPVQERTQMIMARAVQFFDEKGNNISLATAMVMITNLLKQLREAGVLLNVMGKK
jgi:hypothetical protein